MAKGVPDPKVQQWSRDKHSSNEKTMMVTLTNNIFVIARSNCNLQPWLVARVYAMIGASLIVMTVTMQTGGQPSAITRGCRG